MLHATKPIHFGSNRVGALHLCLSRTGLEKEILESQTFITRSWSRGSSSWPSWAWWRCALPGAQAPHSRERSSSERGDLSRRVPAEDPDEVADFYKAFNEMVDGLARARQAILRSHLEIIRAMISVVEAKDRYTQGHCVQVQVYARRIIAHERREPRGRRAHRDRSPPPRHGEDRHSGWFLLKEHRLNKEEIEIVRQHVLIGGKILLHMDSMKDVARWVRHHLRQDGLGCPDGLRGEAICPSGPHHRSRMRSMPC